MNDQPNKESLLANPAILKIISEMEYTDDQQKTIQMILDAEVSANKKATPEEMIARIQAEVSKGVKLLETEAEQALARINSATAIKVANAQHRWRSSIVWAVALIATVLIVMTNLPGEKHALPRLQPPQNETGTQQETSP